MSSLNKDSKDFERNAKKVVKATLVGVGVCTAAIIGPIGIAGVVGLTAAGAAASYLADSLGEMLNGSSDEK